MSILYLLIPLAAVLVIIAAVFFIWSIKTGQFEDLEGPGFRILMDDDEEMIPRDARVKHRHPEAAETQPADAQLQEKDNHKNID
jgi:cbb3-type cytochrome oxidase maturation protein